MRPGGVVLGPAGEKTVRITNFGLSSQSSKGSQKGAHKINRSALHTFKDTKGRCPDSRYSSLLA